MKRLPNSTGESSSVSMAIEPDHWFDRMKSLGIDVGVTKGLDVVLMDGRRQILFQKRRVDIEDVPSIVADQKPDVVAIDSPPAWAISGNSRRAERELRNHRIMSFATPSDSEKH